MPGSVSQSPFELSGIGLDPASTKKQQLFDHSFRFLFSVVVFMQSNLFSNHVPGKIIVVDVLKNLYGLKLH